MLTHFRFSFLFSALALVLAALWGWNNGAMTGLISALFITLILALMEISLSFDNAVINAAVLRNWNKFWLKIFLTLGILIAVFGMRLLFPLAIVAITAEISMQQVLSLALNEPEIYAQKLTAHHGEIAAFGGMFLLLVFIDFFCDKDKETHWLPFFEKAMVKVANNNNISIFIVLVILMIVVMAFATNENRDAILFSAIWGIIIYLAVQLLNSLLESGSETDDDSDINIGSAITRGGIGGFIYLEFLDASFSFDGVIGAFTITSDIIIIMLGLAIGAIFVRSITIFLVEKKTLTHYVFLEHGAHYAIGALAIIMLLSIKISVPEIVTGSIGILFIATSFWASLKK